MDDDEFYIGVLCNIAFSVYILIIHEALATALLLTIFNSTHD